MPCVISLSFYFFLCSLPRIFFLLLRGVFYPPSLPLDPFFGLLKICIFCRHDPISRRWLLFLLFLGSLFLFVCVFPYLCACVLCVMSCRVGRIYRSHFFLILYSSTLIQLLTSITYSLASFHFSLLSYKPPHGIYHCVISPSPRIHRFFSYLLFGWLVGLFCRFRFFFLYLPLSRSLCFPFPLFFLCKHKQHDERSRLFSLFLCGWARSWLVRRIQVTISHMHVVIVNTMHGSAITSHVSHSIIHTAMVSCIDAAPSWGIRFFRIGSRLGLYDLQTTNSEFL